VLQQEQKHVGLSKLDTDLLAVITKAGRRRLHRLRLVPVISDEALKVWSWVTLASQTLTGREVVPAAPLYP